MQRLIIFLLFLLIPIQIVYAESVNISLELSPSNQISHNIGQTRRVNISISPNGNEISGIQADLIYDKQHINIVGVHEGEFFSRENHSTFFNSGNIENINGTTKNIFNVVIGNYSINSSGTFVIFDVYGSGNGTTEINLSNVKIADRNAELVQFRLNNISLTITKESNRKYYPFGIAAAGTLSIVGLYLYLKRRFIS